MLTFTIYFFTALMVLDCIILVMLVLIQLPKKEAGMGQAFGGAATDALFGAGSGNVLTKTTKWGAGVFFGLAIMLTIMGTYKSTSGGPGRLQRIMNANKPAETVPPPTPAVPNTTPNTAVPKVPAPAVNLSNSPAQGIPAIPPQNPPAAPTK
jgi:preprotein translocase subunit SecG